LDVPPTPSETADTGRAVAESLRLVEQFQRALQRRDRQEIVDRLRELVAVRAPMADQWLQLSLMAIDLGEIGLARRGIDLYVESFGGGAAALNRKIGILARIGAFDEALALVRSMPATEPDPFSYALSRGAAAVSAGEAAEARQWLGEAIRLQPESGSAWHSMAQLVDFADESELANRAMAVEPQIGRAPPAERALFYYALSQVHANLGEHARAFAAAARAASETRALYPYDRALDRRTAVEAVAGYDPGRIAGLAGQQSEATGRSIFVMGLPRSGTTLVEQILTSHSDVSDGGEIDLLRLLVHDIGDASCPSLEAYVRKAGARSLARLWRHLLDERFPQQGRVVDKTTDASRKLGVVAAVFPDAPLIWLRRDPLDCAWSCFRTCFMTGIRWSNDLKDMAFDFRLEDQLLAQWRRNLGDRLLVVPFEALVTEPDTWIRTILSHCGLAEEPQVFVPHENKRVVTTASAMQVRQPINRRGIGSAEAYRRFLAPFAEAYFQ
jgi:tetratricopeptide (TPR) repeat protein